MVSRDDFRFVHTLRVRWSEVDAQGVVFNPNYFTYVDVAVTEYYRELGYPYPGELLAHGSDSFAVKATGEFHASARYDELLDLRVRVARLGKSSFTVVCAIHCEDRHVFTGELVYVNVDVDSRRPMPVPDFLRDAIFAYERVAPATPARSPAAVRAAAEPRVEA